MPFVKGLRFNQFKIDGWRCTCGEEYFNPEQAQKILILNKLKKQKFKLKLSKVKSNLILRIPKEVGYALNLNKGDTVKLALNEKNEIVVG